MPGTHLFPHRLAPAQGVWLMVRFPVSVNILIRAKLQVNVKIQPETWSPLAAGRQAAQCHASRRLEHEGGASGELVRLSPPPKTRWAPAAATRRVNGTKQGACLLTSRSPLPRRSAQPCSASTASTARCTIASTAAGHSPTAAAAGPSVLTRLTAAAPVFCCCR